MTAVSGSCGSSGSGQSRQDDRAWWGLESGQPMLAGTPSGRRAPCCGPYCAQTVCSCLLTPPESGSAHRYRGRRSLRAGRRHALGLTMCSMLILANAAQTGAQAPSDPQAYCVNGGADFYPFTGEPCKSGYQLESGNCRRTDGRMVAVPRAECLAQAGTVEVHFLYHGGSPRLTPRLLPLPRR
jgi:hypothetical protein